MDQMCFADTFISGNRNSETIFKSFALLYFVNKIKHHNDLMFDMKFQIMLKCLLSRVISAMWVSSAWVGEIHSGLNLYFGMDCFRN